jgi:two-component SAPR family response regulator
MSTGSRLQGRHQRAIQQCRRALDLLADRVSEAGAAVAEAYKNMGVSLLRQGDLPGGIADLATALKLYRELDNTFNIASVLHDLGVAYETAGEFDRALEHHQQALAYWRELSNPDAWANTLNSIGVLHHLRGDYEQGLASLETALAKAKEAGSLRRQAYVLASLGDLLRDQGDYDRSMEAYVGARQAAEEVDDSRLIAYLLDVTGNLHRLLGQPALAEPLLHRALEQAESIHSPGQLGICKTSLGILAYEKGNLPEALRALGEARDLLSSLGFARDLARAHLHLGQAFFLGSERQKSLKELSLALTLLPATAAIPFLTSEAVNMEPLLEYAATRSVSQSLVSEALERLRGRAEASPADVMGVSPTPVLRIHALGQPQAVLGSEPVANWIHAKAKELLFCLLDSPDGLSKERIGAILWPEHSPERLNSIFHNTMYRLRHVLFPEVVLFEEGVYFFNRDINYWLDVEEFETLLARAERLPEDECGARMAILSQAAELYKGDYLQGLFSDWCLVRRENLRVSYTSALLALGGLHIRAKEYASALQYYNTVLVDDPYQEAAYRQAIRCYLMMGDRASALRKYQECVDILQEELGVSPMPETEALYRQLTN